MLTPTDATSISHRAVATMSRLRSRASEEVANFQPRLMLTTLPARLLPDYTARSTRTMIMRGSGFRIGHGSVFFGLPTVYGRGAITSRLRIGEFSNVSVGCTFELNEEITIGDRVAIGQEVMILTTTHRIGRSVERAGPTAASAVLIEDGAWIGARAVILPGVTVGAGSVVSAGSVVNKSVPANSVVAGVPATVAVKRLPG